MSLSLNTPPPGPPHVVHRSGGARRTVRTSQETAAWGGKRLVLARGAHWWLGQAPNAGLAFMLPTTLPRPQTLFCLPFAQAPNSFLPCLGNPVPQCHNFLTCYFAFVSLPIANIYPVCPPPTGNTWFCLSDTLTWGYSRSFQWLQASLFL